MLHSMEVITTFDHMESSFHKDLCPTVLIEYEAHYDEQWNLVSTNIISIHEVSQRGDKREIELSDIHAQDMKWARAVVTKDAEERWDEAREDYALAKADQDRDFQING